MRREPVVDPDQAIETPCVPSHPRDETVAAFKQLLYTYLKLQRNLESMLEPYGLVLSQFEAMAKIGGKPGMIQQELVSHLLVTKGNVGALLDRLASLGLVERRADPADRRANRLYLTAEGRRAITEVIEKHYCCLTEIFRPLSVPERVELASLLKRIEPR